MPGPIITESATWSSITPPAEGDECAISIGAAPLRSTTLQKLADRDRFLAASCRGLLLPTPPTVSLRYDGLYSVPGTPDYRLLVGPFTLLLEDVLLVSSSAVTVAANGLAAYTWHYLYAYNNAGAVAFEVSTTAPDAAGLWKSGGTTHRYLAAFPTAAAGVPYPFQRVGRTTRFQLADTGVAADLQVAGGLNAAAWTALPWLRPTTAMRLCPPNATALIFSILAAGGASGGTFEVRPDATARAMDFAFVSPNITVRQDLVMPIESALAGASIEYQRNGANVIADVTALGWEE